MNGVDSEQWKLDAVKGVKKQVYIKNKKKTSWYILHSYKWKQAKFTVTHFGSTKYMMQMYQKCAYNSVGELVKK